MTANNRRWGAGGLTFDGTNDYVAAADSDDWNFGSGDFAIEGWIRPNGSSSYGTIFCHGSSGSQYYTFNAYGSTFVFYQYDTSGFNIYVSGTATFSNNTWYHVAVTNIGDTYTLYVNGKQVGTGTDDTAISNWSQPAAIGAIATGDQTSQYFGGDIDALRVYKGRGLSAEEIMSDYQSGNMNFKPEAEDNTLMTGLGGLDAI